LTTTTTLGFRIDGVTSREQPRASPAELQQIRGAEAVLPMLLRVLPPAKAEDDMQRRRRIALARQILSQLELLLLALEASPFFKSHEFIGSSLLFVAHNFGATVHLIDLAKTQPLPPGTVIDHRRQWQFGNREDGFLRGLDKLIECWRRIILELEEQENGGHLAILLSSQYERELAELEQKLQRHGVDTSRFGTGNSKSLQELHCNVHIERTATVEVNDSGQICRVVELVRAWIVAEVDGAPHVLMRLYPIISKSGRNFVSKTFAKKITHGETWKETLHKALATRFSMSPEIVEKHFKVLGNSYKQSTEENFGSVEVRSGYPGLRSIYRVHEVDVGVVDTDVVELAAIGLPDALSFVTVKHDGHFGSSLQKWVWRPHSEPLSDHYHQPESTNSGWPSVPISGRFPPEPKIPPTPMLPVASAAAPTPPTPTLSPGRMDEFDLL